jgi:GT2 family glycosyltransferase
VHYGGETSVPADTATAPHLSVIIVNYNGAHFLRGCVESLRDALTCIDHEIIVVDNASVDGSCALLEQEFPDVRLVRSELNLGFAGGNNLGVTYARGELLLLLNNDTRCLSPLTRVIQVMGDTKIGAAGCTLRYADGRLQHSIGFEHTPLRIVLSWLGLGRFEKASRWFKRVESRAHIYEVYRPAVDWVSGACLLTRRTLWRRLGGFDESFFMYCEDVDYCRRVRQAGFKIAYIPAGQVLHYEGAGKAWAGESTLMRTCRSYLLYVSKHFGGNLRMRVGLALALVFLCRSICYGVSSLLGRRRDIVREKFRAYSRAAAFLASAGVGLRDPGARL